MGRDKEKIRVWRKAYRQTPKGKAAVEKWNHSLRGKLARAVCDQARRHTEERKKYIADWRRSSDGKAWLNAYKHSLEGKTSFARSKAKRKRNLGFEPINERFPSSHAHHIDNQHILHIPASLHKRIPHALCSPETMEKINTVAFNWLLGVEVR